MGRSRKGGREKWEGVEREGVEREGVEREGMGKGRIER